MTGWHEDFGDEPSIEERIPEGYGEEILPDHMLALCEQTETNHADWVAIDGPETGVGVEYWYRHADGREAYVCDDQGSISVSVS